MIDIQTIASGSAGNAYVIRDGATTLLLEAGISVKTLARKVTLASIDACLISHEHADHARAAADLMVRYSIDIFSSRGTLDALGLADDYRAHAMDAEEPCRIGTFTVMPLPMRHDAAEPFGFIVGSSRGGKLLFATDTCLIPYRIPRGTTSLMLECNYSLALLRRSIADGVTAHGQRDRLRMSHLSLEYLLRYLGENKDRLGAVSEIRLLHISGRNGDGLLFKRRVEELTGIPVYVEGGE